MKATWIATLSGLVMAFGAGCATSSGGGGGVSCADGGVCPQGQVCSAQGICEMANVGGTGGGVGGYPSGGAGGATGGVGGYPSGGAPSGGAGGYPSGGAGGSGGYPSGGAGGTGGSSPFDCAGYCAKWASANCSADPTPSQCVASCQSETNAAASQCASQANAWINCVKNTATVSCDANNESVASGCDSEWQSYIACGVCLFPTTDPCGVCNSQSCCSQMQSFWGDPSAVPFLNCADPCTDQTCYDACVSQYSSAGSKYTAWGQCQSSYCSSQCGA